MTNFNDIDSKKLYLKRSANELSNLIVACIVSTVITAFLFWMVSWLWTIYVHTDIGDMFVNVYPELAEDINNIFRQWCIETAIFSNTVSLIASLAFGAVSQLIHVQSHFYYSLGRTLRTIVWGGGISFFVSLFISYQYNINDLRVSFACAVPPTVMLLDKIFAFTATTLPELGGIIDKITSRFSVDIQKAKTAILNHIQTAISAIDEINKK